MSLSKRRHGSNVFFGEGGREGILRHVTRARITCNGSVLLREETLQVFCAEHLQVLFH